MTALPILLPEGFSALVTVDDLVTVNQIIAQKLTPNEYSLNLPEQFSIPISQVKHVLKKYPGENLTKGEIIGIKKHFFGLKKMVLRSTVDGEVVRYERDTGNLIVKVGENIATDTLVSPVEGKVILCDNEKILIETEKHAASGKRSSGQNGEGEIFILEPSLGEDAVPVENVLFYLDSQAIGKVVVGGTFSRELLMKGVGLGVKGIVGTNISEEDIAYLTKKNITTPVIEIDSDTVQQLLAWKGKKVYLDAQANSVTFLQI